MMDEKTKITNRFDRNVVVKSNQLTGSYYKLNLMGQKLICIFISLLNSKERQVKQFYSVTMRELVYLLDIDNSNSAKTEIMEAIYRLNEKNMIRLGNNIYSNWISSVKFNLDGTVEFEFPERLKPHLFELKEKFTAYRLGTIRTMKTVKAIRLYEILKMNEKKGVFEIYLDELKQILDIDPIAYPNFKDFRIRVLEPALNEIKTFTELQFTYKQIKEKGSKKVVGLTITIFPKEFDLESWSTTMDKLKQFSKPQERKTYNVPTSDTATERFIHIYRGFIESVHNFPEQYTFEQYLKDGNMKIIHKAGRKDVEFNYILPL